jgi:hypothetical protein
MTSIFQNKCLIFQINNFNTCQVIFSETARTLEMEEITLGNSSIEEGSFLSTGQQLAQNWLRLPAVRGTGLP